MWLCVGPTTPYHTCPCPSTTVLQGKPGSGNSEPAVGVTRPTIRTSKDRVRAPVRTICTWGGWGKGGDLGLGGWFGARSGAGAEDMYTHVCIYMSSAPAPDLAPNTTTKAKVPPPYPNCPRDNPIRRCAHPVLGGAYGMPRRSNSGLGVAAAWLALQHSRGHGQVWWVPHRATSLSLPYYIYAVYRIYILYICGIPYIYYIYIRYIYIYT